MNRLSRLGLTTLARALALAAIKGYQTAISPRKGFGCAYRHYSGRAGCSAIGYRAIRRYGLLGGCIVLRRRIQLCGIAYRRSMQVQARSHVSQRGDCDLSCGNPCDCGLDLPLVRPCAGISELSSCGLFDWPTRNRKKKHREERKHIPSRRAGS